ncbi:hypothetical protein, partial [Streptomyces chryseus]|uniref:hypothetical protein n=1 Tax=Streptomyces chryseus TaxID=68186 RepID=UPI0031FDA633
PVTRDARDLITPGDLAAVAATVQRDTPGMAYDIAQAVILEALKFEAACAAHPAVGLAPSRVVDAGWHALILHTRVKAGVAARLGYFVHHTPEAPDPENRSMDSLLRTEDAIRAAGYIPRPEMWTAPTDGSIPVRASCQHSDDGGTIVITPKPK